MITGSLHLTHTLLTPYPQTYPHYQQNYKKSIDFTNKQNYNNGKENNIIKELLKMTVSDKILEILNQDERAKRLNTLFHEAAKRQGLQGHELEEARKTFIMLMIAGNKQALETMANDVYDHFNQLQ